MGQHVLTPKQTISAVCYKIISITTAGSHTLIHTDYTIYSQ